MEELFVKLITYSTADFEKTLSTDNDPAFFLNRSATISLPGGNYRMVAGNIVRVQEGIPKEKTGNAL